MDVKRRFPPSEKKKYVSVFIVIETIPCGAQKEKEK